MDLVTHLPRISYEHEAIWVIVERLTKSAHLSVVQITCALEEFYGSYIYICEGLFGYMESQSLLYRTEIPGSWLTIGGTSKEPWERC